ncbi:uncharacterized protein LOC135377652 [Ornithodoros turicata]|uniref:uncharacterized protein LOC135377652 n=1 Tax=Ornithodoros turicata TaxID=34597 RepID=UPI003139310A
MDSINKSCTSVAQEDLMTGEGPVDFQDGGTAESCQEEGEVIGYFELDPSAGLQLMQGENTIYLPPEALGEHVLMSEGGKGCQQIIVVVEEGTEGTVTGLVPSTAAEASFSEECGNPFDGEAFDVQQHFSDDTQIQSEHGHQQVLVLQEQNGTIDRVDEDMITLMDESSAHTAAADQRVLIYTEDGCEIPDGAMKSDVAVGSGIEMADKSPKSLGVEEEKEHITVKVASIGENLAEESKSATILESAKLNSHSDKDSHYESPELNLPCSDPVKLSREPQLTKEIADGNVSVAADSIACVQDNTCSDLPRGNVTNASEGDATDSVYEDPDDISELMRTQVPDSSEECHDGRVPGAATDDAICSTREGSSNQLASPKQKCHKNQDDAVETAEQIGTGNSNGSSVISTNYSSQQEDSIAKSAFELHRDCSGAMNTVVAPDLNMYTPEENVPCNFPYTSVTSPPVQSEQAFCVKGSDSFPSPLLSDYSTEMKTTLIGTVAKEHDVSNEVFSIPNVLRDSETDGKDSAAGHGVELVNEGMMEQSHEAEIPEGGEVHQNAVPVELEAVQIDGSLCRSQPAAKSQVPQYSCNTLKNLATEVINKQTMCGTGENMTRLTMKHIEDTNSLHITETFPLAEPESCKILPAGKRELGSETGTEETLPDESFPNFPDVNSDIGSLPYSNGAGHVPDASNVFDTKNATLEMDTPEHSVLRSEDKPDGENDLPTSMGHGETNASPSDVYCHGKMATENEAFDETKDKDRQKEHVSSSDCDQNFNMSPKEHEGRQNDAERESSAKVNETETSRSNEESHNVDSERDARFTENPEGVQADGVACEKQAREVKHPEKQLPPSSIERTVGEELMAALELVPCQESSPLSAVDDQELEEKLAESSTKTPPKAERKRRKKPEAQPGNTEDPSAGQKRWCLRTPTKPRKRMIIPDSDEDDFDSYESLDAPQAQKSKSEEAFDALLNIFKIEQAKKANEKVLPVSQDERKAGTATSKHRRATRSKKESIKQPTIPLTSTPISYCKAPTKNVEAFPVTSTPLKPTRKQKALHRKIVTPKKASSVTGYVLPTRSMPAGDIRIRCQRPASSPDKGTPQYHCSKCGFRSARMDNIVRHHKEECPHTKNYFRWSHDILKRVTGLDSDYHAS